MKLILALIFIAAFDAKSFSQAQELEELALDIEKLLQFKQILSDLKKGYEVLSGGYNTIKDISQGNFSLHKGYLDGLLAVSPAVAQYKKIGEIISNQVSIVKEYKSAWNRFSKSTNFSLAELDYIARVYKGLSTESLQNLESLLNVITANKLRMSDEERLHAIDAIHESMEEKLQFLRSFNSRTSVLALQREKDRLDIKSRRALHGLEK